MTDVPPPTFDGRSPFAGRKLFIWNSPTHRVLVDGPVDCLAHAGCHLFVRDADGKEAWVNLNLIPSIEIRDGDAPAPHAPAVDPAQVADALAAYKANPGPLKDTGR